MKKVYFIAIILMSCLSCSTNGNQVGSVTDKSVENVDSIKKSVADEIKSWGALDAYFDENNYFVYCVNPSDLSASGDEVAAAMFPNVEEVPGVKGCIVMDFYSKKELGRYNK